MRKTITTSNHIDYMRVLTTANRMLGTKEESFGFYMIVAINTGLRVGDILSLNSNDFKRGHILFREQKTNKAKKVVFNDIILGYFSKLKGNNVFRSQKGSVFSIQQINRKIKQVFPDRYLNFSSHSLRKSFGRRVYDNHNQSENALVMLSELYNHASTKVTRRYLDITQEQLDDIYMNL